jgi:transposase
MTRYGLFYHTVQTRAFNTAFFGTSLRTLCFRISEAGQGECVFIMDNVAFHKTREINAAIEANGHRIMFLPPYSSFLNPIINVFSKWKGFVKEERPKTKKH